MTITKRKKKTRQRGSHTHGYGAKKKHRGAGSRGGRGLAGSGKRAAHKKQLILKKYGKSYFGKHGFKVPYKKTIIKAINLSDIEQKLPKLLKKDLIKKEKDIFIIDLRKLGYNKLLGAGKITKKFKITTKFISKKAKDKVQRIGGEIVTI